jgi:hypothetical protein
MNVLHRVASLLEVMYAQSPGYANLTLYKSLCKAARPTNAASQLEVPILDPVGIKQDSHALGTAPLAHREWLRCIVSLRLQDWARGDACACTRRVSEIDSGRTSHLRQAFGCATGSCAETRKFKGHGTYRDGGAFQAGPHRVPRRPVHSCCQPFPPHLRLTQFGVESPATLCSMPSCLQVSFPPASQRVRAPRATTCGRGFRWRVAQLPPRRPCRPRPFPLDEFRASTGQTLIRWNWCHLRRFPVAPAFGRAYRPHGPAERFNGTSRRRKLT